MHLALAIGHGMIGVAPVAALVAPAADLRVGISSVVAEDDPTIEKRRVVATSLAPDEVTEEDGQKLPQRCVDRRPEEHRPSGSASHHAACHFLLGTPG
jgi:hypothetical protein